MNMLQRVATGIAVLATTAGIPATSVAGDDFLTYQLYQEINDVAPLPNAPQSFHPQNLPTYGFAAPQQQKVAPAPQSTFVSVHQPFAVRTAHPGLSFNIIF